MLKIAGAIFGAIGGYFISVMLFGWVEDEILHTSILVISSAVAAGLSIKYYDNIVIFGTAVLGSFCFVHGFSLIIDDPTLSVYN